jgi:hypothetical protein
MGQGRRRLLLSAAACLAVLAVTGTAAAAQPCGSRVLADWRDGRLDGTYPVACYRQALAQLPEDVRVYSSAQADITRALQQRLTPASGSRAHRGSAGGNGVSPMLVVAITVGLLAAAGSVAAALR